MKHRSFLSSAFIGLAFCLTAAGALYAENLLDVVDAAQNTIQTKYPNKDSIARKLALEELEKIARSDRTDEEKIKVILEKYPASSAGLADKTDLNSNGIPDEWEKKFKISDGFTAPDSDEDSDGFSLLEEYKAGTDPTDPIRHPKYISRIYVSAVSRQLLAGLELVSVAENVSQNSAVFNVTRTAEEDLNTSTSATAPIRSATITRRSAPWSLSSKNRRRTQIVRPRLSIFSASGRMSASPAARIKRFTIPSCR